MKADFITAVKLNENEDFVTYLFDVNVQWEDLDNEQSGIVEIDRNVFKMLEQNVEPDPNFIMKQMYDRHIRIMQHASEMDIDRCCIDRVPYYIIGQILGEYSISHQLSETPIFIYPDLLKLILADDQVRDIFTKHKVMSEQEIEKWVDSGKAMDKAGAYGIQNEFCVFVDKIDGNYTSIVGLPTQKVYDILKNYID